MDYANDIPARLREMAERPNLEAVVLIVALDDGNTEVYGFGEAVKHGVDVEHLLDIARRIIRLRG
jgi:hypothetical protein